MQEQKDILTDRQANRQTDKQTDRHTNVWTEMDINSQDKQTDGLTDRQTDKKVYLRIKSWKGLMEKFWFHNQDGIKLVARSPLYFASPF